MYPGIPENGLYWCDCTQAYMSHKWRDNGLYLWHVPRPAWATMGVCMYPGLPEPQMVWWWLLSSPSRCRHPDPWLALMLDRTAAKDKRHPCGTQPEEKNETNKKMRFKLKKDEKWTLFIMTKHSMWIWGVSPFFQKKRKAFTGKEIAKKYFDYNGVKQKLFASLIIHVFFFWVHIHQSGVTCTPICLQKNQICTLKIL